MTCTFDPHSLEGLGMFHCPECGEMVVAGLSHPPGWTEEMEVDYIKYCQDNPISDTDDDEF